VVAQRLRIHRHLEALVGERHPEMSPRASEAVALPGYSICKSGWARRPVCERKGTTSRATRLAGGMLLCAQGQPGSQAFAPT
jgi:hypothetical protein